METALPETRAIFNEHGLQSTPLDEVQRVLEVFDAYGYSGHNIVVDLSLARGLRYYTGLVFEMYHDGPRGPFSCAVVGAMTVSVQGPRRTSSDSRVWVLVWPGAGGSGARAGAR